MFVPHFYRLSIICLLFLILPNFNTHAMPHIKTLKERTSIAGKWKIKLGDNKSYSLKNYNDSNWDSIEMPGRIIKYSLKKENKIKGIFWLRKKIKIDNINREPIGLILGTIGNADETFFNGKKIGGLGKFPPNENSMWNHPRHYVIPNKLIEYGQINTIAIRISYYGYGEMLGTLAITNYNDWKSHKIDSNFAKITLNYLLIAMGLLITIILLIFYVRRPESSEYLHGCLQFFFGFWIILENCNYWNTFNGSMLLKFIILGYAWVGLNVSHAFFLHRIYNFSRKKIETIFLSFMAITFIIAAIVFVFNSIAEVAPIFIHFSIALGFYNFSCHIYAIYNKIPLSKFLSIIGIAGILTATHDGISYYFRFSGYSSEHIGYSFSYILFPFGSFFFFLGIALILINRFINVSDKLDNLNIELENKVNKRKEELTNAKDEIEAGIEEMEAIHYSLLEVNNELRKSELIHEIDMGMAANVQTTIFPKTLPESNEYDIAFIHKPTSSVSSNLYDFYQKNELISGLSLFEVSGQGLSPGLITLLAKSIIYRNFNTDYNAKLTTILEKINNELIGEISGTGTSLTGIMLRFNYNIIEYINSDHQEIKFKSSINSKSKIILDNNNNSIKGQNIGIQKTDKVFKALTFKLNKGDCLFLHSRCLNESKNQQNIAFSDKHILTILDKAPNGTAQEILDFMINNFYDFIEKKENIINDLTAIIIKKK